VKRVPAIAAVANVLLALAVSSASGQDLARKPRVEHFVDDYTGSFSPDGKTIVFQRLFSTQRFGVDTHPPAKRSVLLLMRADGSRKRVLCQAARFVDDPSFSPDGRSILFLRNDRIYVMRRDGSRARAVRRDPLDQDLPRFSPDGTRISFWPGSAQSADYFVMNADGTGLRRIARGEPASWGCPSWFPDGKRLVCARGYNLRIASVDGMDLGQITHVRLGALYRPSVSPDGRWIAFDGEWSGNGIFVMRADGTGKRRITTSDSEITADTGASWSPDSRRIVFSGYRGRFKGAGVYIVDRDGSGLRRLSNFGRRASRPPGGRFALPAASNKPVVAPALERGSSDET
jgi:TolB protein